MPPARLTPKETLAKIEQAAQIVAPENDQYLCEHLKLVRKLKTISEPREEVCKSAEYFAAYELVLNDKQLQPVTEIGPTGLLRASNAYIYARDRLDELYAICGRRLDEQCKQDITWIKANDNCLVWALYGHWLDSKTAIGQSTFVAAPEPLAKAVAKFLDSKGSFPKRQKEFSTQANKEKFDSLFVSSVVEPCRVVVDRLGQIGREFRETTLSKAKVREQTGFWLKVEALCESILANTDECLDGAYKVVAASKRTSRLF